MAVASLNGSPAGSAELDRHCALYICVLCCEYYCSYRFSVSPRLGCSREAIKKECETSGRFVQRQYCAGQSRCRRWHCSLMFYDPAPSPSTTIIMIVIQYYINTMLLAPAASTTAHELGGRWIVGGSGATFQTGDFECALKLLTASRSARTDSTGLLLSWHLHEVQITRSRSF